MKIRERDTLKAYSWRKALGQLEMCGPGCTCQDCGKAKQLLGFLDQAPVSTKEQAQ